MDWLVIAGALCIGLLIGSFVGYYLNEAEEMSYATLINSISILAGGGVIALFGLLAPGGLGREIWFYPVGLLLGFFTAPLSDLAFNKLYEKWGPSKEGSIRRRNGPKK